MAHEGRLNVLHLIDTGGPGGAETIFHSLVTGLPQSGWRSTPAVPVVDWLHDALISEGVHPIVLSEIETGGLPFIQAIRELIRRYDIDLIHAHLLGSGVYASLATLFTQIPVLCTLHGLPDLDEADPRLRLKLRILARPRNRIVFVSESLKEAVGARWSLPARCVRVVHNGVALDRPELSGTERSELGARHGEFLVGAVGNLRPAKDYPNLLRATAMVRDAGCPIRVVILGQGGGAMKDELLALRAELNLDDVVSFLGFHTDARRLMSGFDLFVMSSITEGFSLSTVEALSMGIPVVATRCGGPEEILTDEHTGFLVPPRDPGALSAGILRVYRDPELARQLGERGRAELLQRFSSERMIGSYADLYEEAVVSTASVVTERARTQPSDRAGGP